MRSKETRAEKLLLNDTLTYIYIRAQRQIKTCKGIVTVKQWKSPGDVTPQISKHQIKVMI